MARGAAVGHSQRSHKDRLLTGAELHGSATVLLTRIRYSSPQMTRILIAAGLLVGLIVATLEPSSVTAAPASAVLVGAGDIASCAFDGDSKTAALLENIAGTVFTAGDNAYEDGSSANFKNCYAPSWGRFLNRTRPTPGNHDYNTKDAGPYYAYFGARAGEAGLGYYAFTLGAWRIIMLNSNLDMGVGSPQLGWLAAELQTNPAKCSLSVWHHPRFSSGLHGSDSRSNAVWEALYKAGVDVVVSAHDHDYERFAPQTPLGKKDLARGIRQFVVGTGGAGLRGFLLPRANSEVRNAQTWGVIKLTLSADSYSWRFVPVAGKTFTDAGSSICH